MKLISLQTLCSLRKSAIVVPERRQFTPFSANVNGWFFMLFQGGTILTAEFGPIRASIPIVC